MYVGMYIRILDREENVYSTQTRLHISISIYILYIYIYTRLGLFPSSSYPFLLLPYPPRDEEDPPSPTFSYLPS